MTEALPWLGLASLLALSGSFSASETALFSLSESDRPGAGARVRQLLERPREVLVTILLGNVLVNLFFLAIAPRVLAREMGLGGLLSAFGALVAILLFGEILPKTLALRAPHLVARVVSLPLAVAVEVLGPARKLISSLIDLTLRALGDSGREERGISPEALAQALEDSAKEGLLAPGEADLLAEIVELGDLRVREIMTPRVDVLALDVTETPAERKQVLREARRRRFTWLPVIREHVDQVVGHVRMRDLLADPDRPLEQLVMPIKFVPEVASGLALLGTFREDRLAEAVVVDEWGGTAGIVTVEDLFEELVRGEFRVEGEALEKPVVRLGEGRFRVSGGLSIRDWNENFGARVVATEFETVGGFVTALLGRIPRAGDRVFLGAGLVCEVHEVRERRVQTLDLYLEDLPADAADTGAADGGRR